MAQGIKTSLLKRFTSLSLTVKMFNWVFFSQKKDVNTHTHTCSRMGWRKMCVSVCVCVCVGGVSIKSCSLLQQYKFVTGFFFGGKHFFLLEFCPFPDSISGVQ